MQKLSWPVFGLFVAVAAYLSWHPRVFDFTVRLGGVKALVLGAWLGFLAFSYYASTRESLLGTIRKMNRLHWGRQIGIDLYLGAGLSMLLIYLNEGSVVVVLLWLVPVVLFVNLATLVYVFLNFDRIVARFLGA